MSKKLWLLNLLLIGALAFTARELRRNWEAAREREQRMLSKEAKPAAAPPVAATPVPAPLQAAGYSDVAQNNLFAKDRNPNVIVDPPPPPAPPPPFPKFYGVMNLGEGPEAIMAELAGRPQRSFKAGDNIGEFKLTAIGADELELQWKDKSFTKKFADLRDKSNEGQQQAAAVAPRSEAPVVAARPAPVAEPAKAGPGADTGGGYAACSPGDNSPAGTVMDGKRKVVSDTPFGRVCRWEAVR